MWRSGPEFQSSTRLTNWTVSVSRRNVRSILSRRSVSPVVEAADNPSGDPFGVDATDAAVTDSPAAAMITTRVAACRKRDLLRNAPPLGSPMHLEAGGTQQELSAVTVRPHADNWRSWRSDARLRPDRPEAAYARWPSCSRISSSASGRWGAT